MSAPSIPVIQQTAGRGAARAAARRRHISTGAGSDRRAGWLTYVILGVVILISAYPLYYAFLLASSNAGAIAQHPIPSLVPHGEFFDNVHRVLTSKIQFWKAFRNSVIVASLIGLAAVVALAWAMRPWLPLGPTYPWRVAAAFGTVMAHNPL